MDSEMIIAIHTELKRIWKLEHIFVPRLGVTKYTVSIDLKGGCIQDGESW